MAKQVQKNRVTEMAHKRAVSARKESFKRLQEGLARLNSGKLQEGTVRSAAERALVREAIVLERAQILEALGGSPDQIADAYSAMISALQQLAQRTGSGELASVVAKLDAAAPEDPLTASQNPKQWASFQRVVADAAVVTKGLLGIADSLDDEGSGAGGMVASLASTHGGAHTDPLRLALRRLSPDNSARPGMLARLTGGGKNPAERFCAALSQAAGRSAGFARHVNVKALCDELLNMPVGRFLGAWRNYGSQVSEAVPESVLVQLTKTSLAGAVKSMFTGMGSGGHYGQLKAR
jgi:hypothetical protein